MQLLSGAQGGISCPLTTAVGAVVVQVYRQVLARKPHADGKLQVNAFKRSAYPLTNNNS